MIAPLDQTYMHNFALQEGSVLHMVLTQQEGKEFFQNRPDVRDTHAYVNANLASMIAPCIIT